MQDPVSAAREYKRRGWNPLPLRPGDKRPTGSEWQRTQVPDDQFEPVFTGKGVGIGLGTQSNGVYDADLDHELTVKMQRHFMPETPAMFGRASKPVSHLLYQALPGEEVARASFADVDNVMLAELRGTGHQVMMPPSVHPSGEQVTWVDPTALPAEVSVQKVIKALGWCSAAAMLARSWDAWNDRHHVLVGALAGGFARHGVGSKLAEQFVRAVCLYGGDHEIDDRVRIVRDTYHKLEEDPDAIVTGFPALQEIIGTQRVQRLTRWTQLPKDDQPRVTLTDDGNALRFVDSFGEQVRFVHEHNAFYIWDGSRWAKDTRENVIALAREVPKQIDLAATKIIDDDTRKTVEKWANASRNVQRIKAIPTLARADDRIKVSADSLDADPWLFNVSNGTINLRTGGISDHDKNDLLTLHSPITFNPRATAPLWDSYLLRVFDNDRDVIDFVQRSVGYSLTALTVEQAFFILHGPQGTGKTTFIETLREIFGEYAMNADPSTFMQKQRSGRANPEIARLQGARFVSSSETEENERLAAGIVKRLSGNTRITASHLYAPDFEFEPVLKLWIDTNHKPRIAAHDDAVWARLVLIPFEVVLRHTALDIKGYKDLLKAELPGILRWAVEGCLKWQADGLTRPDKIKNAANEYRTESDALQQFIDDACIVGAHEVSGATDLYRSYNEWCETANERPFNMRRFKQAMTERGFAQDRRSTGNVWLGIRAAGTRATAEPIRTQANPFQTPHPNA